jgi:hypothetical protein
MEISYNERSWAIDLIGYLKGVVSTQNRSIKDAGGEQTIRTEGGSLFPDVLLFGDRSLALILQGWELKMPDTSIDDYEFIHNATQKAIALGLDSFILWNVSHAHMYIRQGETKDFVCSYRWDDLSHIRRRDAVVANRRQWEELATKIINHVNDLFDRGSLEGRQFVEAYKSGGITSLIMENTDDIAGCLQRAARRDARLKAEITLWWDRYKSEYGGEDDPYKKLAQANISNWVGKFLFAHILQGKDRRAQVIGQICDTTTPDEALSFFEELSRRCNFWTIFSGSIGLKIMSDRAWDQMRQLHKLLTDLRIGSIEQSQLSGILESTVAVAIRKLRGQYPTPQQLAEVLVRLCIDNIEDDKVIDPCCGSGTIARAAIELKMLAGVLPDKVSSTVFASDQDHQAVQIATFALAKPDLMDTPLRLFQNDAFALTPETALQFRHPRTGEIFTEHAGVFQAITSNLPFVSQEGRVQYRNAINDVNASFDRRDVILPGKADIAAYLPFSFHKLLASNGKLGIIITNAWLGTTWGDVFFNLLERYYNIKVVVTSGAGRWFQNSSVVTNIIVMEKKDSLSVSDDPINFVVLTRPLVEFSDPESIDLAASQIRLGRQHNDTMNIRSVTRENMKLFRTYGLGGNAQFVDCDWVLNLPLVPVSSLFKIRRGARRGWDKLFYPARNHGIEQEYIIPVLKSPSDIKNYTTTARNDAFVCSRSMDELEALGHVGALTWIRRFENAVNKANVPLVESLAISGMYWYEMKADGLADIVMPLNFGYRLFISRLNPPSFVNQRLVCFSAVDDIDIGLCHALLNSAISLFMIEGMGFGRGQGALDLHKDRIENLMHMLDPALLDCEQANKIKASFSRLQTRDILEIADELDQPDRIDFDDIVIESFGLTVSREQIYESLLKLVGIRQTATAVFN